MKQARREPNKTGNAEPGLDGPGQEAGLSRGNMIKRAKAKQPAIFSDLDQMCHKYGPATVRIVGLRYFKTLRQRASLKREIEEKRAELAELESKAGGI